MNSRRRNAPEFICAIIQKLREEEERPTGTADWLRCSDVRVSPLVSGVNMAAVDVIVDNLVTLWRIPSIRQNFHWIFLLISVVGSVLKELELVPQTYFSSTRNALNV